jgi:hypothetical protein
MNWATREPLECSKRDCTELPAAKWFGERGTVYLCKVHDAEYQEAQDLFKSKVEEFMHGQPPKRSKNG